MTDKVMKTAFMVSFLGHCLFLGVPGIKVNSQNIDKPEDISIRIEIEKPALLPKIDLMREEKKLKEVIKEPKPPEPEPEAVSEEVVIEEPIKEPVKEDIEIIDPTLEAMLRYQDMVKQRIEETRRYPLWAKKQGIEGIIHVSFVVLSNGMSQDIKIIHSSGSRILDEETIATIKRANPFPPIPRKISDSSVQVEVSIVFALEYGK